MNITKEDLMYAAKACGIEGYSWTDDPFFTGLIRHHEEFDSAPWLWNPAVRPEDCWRMCRQLGLIVNWDSKLVARSLGNRKQWFSNDTGLTDMEAATLVAAQIGRAP
jgi:hypothetical protein